MKNRPANVLSGRSFGMHSGLYHEISVIVILYFRHLGTAGSNSGG